MDFLASPGEGASPDMNAGIGSIFEGIGQSAKNMYNIQMNRRVMDMKQQDLDNDTKYKNAQVDYLEGRGQLAGAQADAYRFNIKQADDQGQTKIDATNDNIDAAHMQVQGQASQYRQLLTKALQTPEGQDYMANSMGGATDATGMPQGEGMAGGPSMGSSVVNTIMPGVGNSQQQQQGPPSYVPTTARGAENGVTRTGMPGKRNASLEKAMGNIDSMGIDNREDAQYAMEKYYGADWNQNPEAVKFMNSKFGNAAPAGGPGAGQPQNNGEQSPYVQTSDGAMVPAGGAGPQADVGAMMKQGNPQDMIPVTGPDGNPYKVPRANLQKAVQRGYRVRQQ